MKSVTLLLVVFYIFIVDGKLKLDIYPDVGICDGRDDWSAKTVSGEFVEIRENVYGFDGSVNFITNMTAPWKIHIYGEKLEMGTWSKRAEKTFDDLCFEMNNPTGFFYAYAKKKNFKNCPLKPNVIISYIIITIIIITLNI